MTTGSNRPHCIDLDVTGDVSTWLERLPDVVVFTAAVVRAARTAGWTVTEHRTQGWLYMTISRREQLVVYKLVGPHFDSDGYHYRGHRSATINVSADAVAP